MADADLAEKAANRAAALTRLPSLQSDIVLLAVIAILLVRLTWQEEAAQSC